MPDSHLRILRLVAERRRRDLSDHDVGGVRTTTIETSLQHLENAATRAGSRVAQAEARRFKRAVARAAHRPPPM